MGSELRLLTPQRVDVLAGRWYDVGLWADIEYLADRFVHAGPRDARLCWHHLVLAAGNFKRQGGRRLLPQPLGDHRADRSTRPAAMDIPGVGTVDHEDPGTWRRLSDHLPGAGVATTTTLLASLWPLEHVVFDWRVRAAANALRLADDLEPCVSVAAVIDSCRRIAEISWEDYETVRGWVLSVEAPPASVERALYELARLVRPLPGRSWSEYTSAIVGALHAA